MSQGSPSQPINRSSPQPNSEKNHAFDDSQNGAANFKEEEEEKKATVITRSNRPSRACTIRAASRLYSSVQPTIHRKSKVVRREKKEEKKEEEEEEEEEEDERQIQCSKIVTTLVEEPPASQLPRWNLRAMWELASVLNFLHVFRPLLNISVEFSAEEFETALLMPNDTLGDIHMPLLKAIPPIIRMALTRDTWVTVLCRKLRDWWFWVAEGDIPIVAAQGAEVEAYKSLDPGVRVVILKALCDIRVEQEDIRSYIDNSLRHGVYLSTFRKERIGGDSHGISYWYEDDPIIGHRLYRETRKTEVVQMKKGKAKGSKVLSNTSYQWEAVATNFDEFQDVAEKLCSSRNRTEASLGKKLMIDMLPEIEKVHKRKERLLKKQHRQALLLDNYLGVDGLATGRSLRDRKPVTYTFDDYDRSINEAIKVTKQKQPSPEPGSRRELIGRHETLSNGRRSGPSHASEHLGFSMLSPKSPDFDDNEEEEEEEEHESDLLDRSNRRRQRPMRYSEKDFVEALSDNDADYDSDDDIVGEAVYDEEYLRKRKQRKNHSSSSEGDDEYQWDEDNVEEEEEEDEDDEDSLSISEDSDKPRKFKQLQGRTRSTRRETKLRSVGNINPGLRRSKRATRNRINYRQLDMSDSEPESMKPEKSYASDNQSGPSENGDYMVEDEDSDDNEGEDQETKEDNEPPTFVADEGDYVAEEGAYAAEGEKEEQKQPPQKADSPNHEELEGSRTRHFLDLNELAPTSGFDDGLNTVMKDEENDVQASPSS